MTRIQHRENNYSVPSYTYRDPSLAGLVMGDPLALQRQNRFFQRRFLVKLCFIVLTLIWAIALPLHDDAVYATYKQGSCTIVDKSVQEHENKDKHGNVTSITYNPV